jgi:Nuclear transport factor 2 (NTF2) domain
MATAVSPAVVAQHFVKQYYKTPVSELFRFYHEDSTFCHAEGSNEEDPVTGLDNIKEKIQSLGLTDAVDLDGGSVDAQPSVHGEALSNGRSRFEHPLCRRVCELAERDRRVWQSLSRLECVVCCCGNKPATQLHHFTF